MGAYQDEPLFTQAKHSSRRLILFVVASFSLVFAITALSHLVSPVRNISQINELNAIIDAHRLYLDNRAASERRAFVASRRQDASEGSLGGLPPNSTGVIISLLGNISDIATLAEPARFLGVGLANGAIGSHGASATTPPPTGLDLIAENIGFGLSSTIANSSAVTSLISPLALSGGSNGTIGQAVLALAQGLGGGAASGLKLTKATTASYDTSGLNGVAGNFGQGLSSSLLSNVQLPSLSFLTSSTQSGTGGAVSNASASTSIPNVIPELVSGLGSGIGQGAAIGLGLQNNSDSTVAASGIAGMVQELAKGAVSSFLESGAATSIMNFMSSTKDSMSYQSMLPEIASGLGAGLGHGAAIGLGLQNRSIYNAAANGTTGLAQNFAQDLMSSFLENGTAAKLMIFQNRSMKSIMSSGGFSKDSAPKTAKGLAVGIVSGIASVLTGSKAILKDTSSFNDSMGGTVTAFGQGLGSQGAKLAAQYLANKTMYSSSSKNKRLLVDSARLSEYGSHTSLTPRKRAITGATDLTDPTDLAETVTNLNSSNMNPFVQSSVDSLTCQGIGGLLGVFYGLLNSETITPDNVRVIKLSLLDQTFNFTSGGNNFSVNPVRGKKEFTVNNMAIMKYVLIGALHIAFATTAYFFAIPALLLTYSSQRVSHLVRGSVNRTTARPTKGQLCLAYSIPPLVISAFVFGVLFRGGAKHFTSLHEISGLIILVQSLIAGVTTQLLHPNAISPSAQAPLLPNWYLNFAHRTNIGLLLVLSGVTLLSGFADLSAVCLCINITMLGGSAASVFAGIGWLILTPMVIAGGMEALKLWVDQTGARPRNAVEKGDVESLND